MSLAAPAFLLGLVPALALDVRSERRARRLGIPIHTVALGTAAGVVTDERPRLQTSAR